MKYNRLTLSLLIGFSCSHSLAKSPMVEQKESNQIHKKASKPKDAKVNVVVETSMGTIEIELDKNKAPETVHNFMEYVDKNFYENLIFHRIINNFMVQGGGFDKDMKLKNPEASIKNEANNGLKNLKGTIAMARTPDPHSASSQFFINLKDNDFLNYKGSHDWGYAVFGKVTSGMDIVEKMGQVPTKKIGQMGDVPVEPIIIKSIRKANTNEKTDNKTDAGV